MSRLAEVNNLRLQKVSTVNPELKQAVDGLSGKELRDYLAKRPEFVVNLHGYYLNLVHFVNGLQHLNYVTYIGDMNIKSLEDGEGRLEIQLQIKI